MGGRGGGKERQHVIRTYRKRREEKEMEILEEKSERGGDEKANKYGGRGREEERTGWVLEARQISERRGLKRGRETRMRSE
jgi:hypothetical protein